MALPGIWINWPVLLVWAVFYGYWAFSILYDAFSGKLKKVEKSPMPALQVAERMLLLAALFLVIMRFGQQYYPLGAIAIQASVFSPYSGIAIAILGILFAIWARIHLGGNWSPQAEMKRGQTITRTGPYAIVRHPIYLGITLGVIGSAIFDGTIGGLIAIAPVLIFSYLRISTEEKLMREKFAKGYVEYRRKVKAFIPGLL